MARLTAIGLLWLLSLADLLLTVELLGLGAYEANPLARLLFDNSTAAAATFKVGSMTAYCAILYLLWGNRFARVTTWVFVGVYVAIVCYELLLLRGR
jgi:uncharacterized membrane protein (DUF485 family)